MLLAKNYIHINRSQSHYVNSLTFFYYFDNISILNNATTYHTFQLLSHVLNICLIDIDTHDISGYTIATQYLRNLQISEAEMTQYLCNIRMANTNCLTKKYRVPFFCYVLHDKTVIKYLNRSIRFKSLNLTQYIR